MRIPKCSNCNINGVRIDKWDSYACKNCLTWLEKQCTDVNCDYCFDKPNFPVIEDFPNGDEEKEA